MKKIHETWPNDVRIVLHTRPLDFHNRAMPAAIAAIAAHQQGKFWPYHDLLFERKKLEDTDLTAYAQELGLDMARFEADLANPKIKAKVDRANAACVKIGASGTPAFFVNGRKLSGAKPFEEFEVVIKEELAKAKKAVEGGIAKADIYSHMLKQGSKNAGSQLEEVVHHFDLTGSPMLGSPSAIATMVVFSDFQ